MVCYGRWIVRHANDSYTLSLANQVVEEARTHFGDHVFKTLIPRNVRLSECPSFGKPIVLCDLRSKGCEGYLALASELIQREAARKIA